MVIKDFPLSKRKAKKIRDKKTNKIIRIIPAAKPTIDYPIPLNGRFKPLTNLFLNYYEKILPGPGADLEDRVFPIGRKRAYAIIKYSTGLWCHYFRSQRLSYTVNKVRSAIITAKVMGIENPATLMHYYKTAWTEHKDIFE